MRLTAEVILYPQTSYHNTITIDGQNQPRASGKTNRWVSTGGMDYVLGSFDGYKNLTHVRGIVFVKPDYWVVVDRVEGEGEHTYDQSWHFPADAALVEDPVTKAVHTTFPIEQGDGYAKEGQLLMVPVDVEKLRSEPSEFFIATNRMGSNEPVKSTGWKYSRQGTPPVSFDLVLYPYKGSQVPRVKVERLAVEGNPVGLSAIKITHGERIDYVIVSWKNACTVSIPAEEISIDGEVAVIRTKNGRLSRVSGAGLKSVIFQGQVVYAAEEAKPEVGLDFEMGCKKCEYRVLCNNHRVVRGGGRRTGLVVCGSETLCAGGLGHFTLSVATPINIRVGYPEGRY
ncbi:MAG: heparinase II/III domain-containing protein [Armatimonadota bacterium]